MQGLTTTSGARGSGQRSRSSTSARHSPPDRTPLSQHHQRANPGPDPRGHPGPSMSSQLHQGLLHEGEHQGPSMTGGRSNGPPRPSHYTDAMWKEHEDVRERLSRGVSFSGFPNQRAAAAAEALGATEAARRQGNLEPPALQGASTRSAGLPSFFGGLIPLTHVVPGTNVTSNPLVNKPNCLYCTGSRKCDKKIPCGNCAKTTPPRKCLYPGMPIFTIDPRLQRLNPLIIIPRPPCFFCQRNKKGGDCNRESPCNECRKRGMVNCNYPSGANATPGRASSPCKRCQNEKGKHMAAGSKFEPCNQGLPACQHCCALGLDVALECTYSPGARTSYSRSSEQDSVQTSQASSSDPTLFSQRDSMSGHLQSHPEGSGHSHGAPHTDAPERRVGERQSHARAHQDYEAAGASSRDHEAQIVRGSRTSEPTTTATLPPNTGLKRTQQDRRGSSSGKDTPTPEGKRKKK